MKRKTSTFIRALTRCPGKPWPIKEVPGRSPPSLVGEPGHYVNSSGDVIRFPNAYRKAWGKPRYVASTVRVEVGALWVQALEHLGLGCPLCIVQDYAIDLEGRTA